jgi:predicted nucleotidyltransferase
MPESYSKTLENRTDARGIARVFPFFDESSVRAAFDAVIGAKEFPSEDELRLVERAKKYCRALVKFPAIRRIWVCNSLSMNAADADSDIDLFVETAPGRIWTGRAVTTLFFALLGVRRHGNKVRGRFCLSFFAAEGADFGKIAIPDDVYLSEWARRLVPVDGGPGFPEIPSFENVLGRNRTTSALANNPQTGATFFGLFACVRRSRTFACDDFVPSCGLFS